MKYLKNLNFFTESKKYIETFEKVDEYKIYYIISTKDLKKSLVEINLPKETIQDIIKYNTNIIKNKYVYISIIHEPAHINQYENWGWMPLESECYNYENNEIDYFFDGKDFYDKNDYLFNGYDNLTDEEYKEIQEIRKNIEIKNLTRKYNL